MLVPACAALGLVFFCCSRSDARPNRFYALLAVLGFVAASARHALLAT